MVRNTGKSVINDLELEYWLNNASKHETFSWSGFIDNSDTMRIVMPTGSLWSEGIQPSDNVFHVQIKKVNGNADDYAYNDRHASPFTLADNLPQEFSIEFKTNNYPLQTTYRIMDQDGNMVTTSNFTVANKVYEDFYDLNGCYTIVIEDAGSDGIAWWGNPGQGTGYIRIKDKASNVIKTFQPDFGSHLEYNFTAGGALSLNEKSMLKSVTLYPNPTHGKFMVKGSGLHDALISVSNSMGQPIQVQLIRSAEGLECVMPGASPGVYFVSIATDRGNEVRKVTVY